MSVKGENQNKLDVLTLQLKMKIEILMTKNSAVK